MDAERRRRIEDIFEAVLDVPRAERAGHILRACGDDEELRGEVEALLRAHERASGILEQAPTSVPDQLSSDPVRIGPYALLRELGQGGMGTVWLAERADGQFHRYVAVKIIRSGPYSLDMHRRFLVERQILAALDHPHIARLLDGGFTDEGRPYLVMEYVEGLPIDRYCDRLRLGVADRLRLFRDVAKAVQYAHQNLIVHRDLKPSNILVKSDGTPKLLDFGVAKILGPGAALGAPPTITGRLPMTPEYASPEQVRGESITTASDVYSMGVLLYELLSGFPPHELGSASPAEIVEAVALSDPPRPSRRLRRAAAQSSGRDRPAIDGRRGTRNAEGAERIAEARGTSVERLVRRLEGDLDAIVMMALRKEPTRRYASAEALAHDIANHLDALPVQAHRGGATYRARKFLRRHRSQAIAAAAVGLSLLAGAGVATWQAVEAGYERNRAEAALRTAEAERDRARAVTSVLVDLFSASDPKQAALQDTAAARALLRLGMSRAGELGDQPLLQATLLDALGEVQANLGHLEEAEQLVRRGLALRRDVLGESDPEVARSLNHLGRIARRRGRYDHAERLYREALDLQVEAFGERSLEVAQTLYELGFLAPYRGHPRESVELFGRVLEIRRDLVGPEDPLVASSLMDEAAALKRIGRYAEAESRIREALAMRERLLGEDHPDVANSLLHLGDLLRDRGRAEREAEANYRRAIDIQRRAYGDRHPALAHGLSSLAVLLATRGEYGEAEGLARELLDLRQNLFGRRSPPAAETLRTLGTVLRMAGRPDEAEAAHVEALGIWRETMGERHAVVAGELRSLAAARAARGDYDDAAELYRNALDILDEVVGGRHPVKGAILTDFARLRVLERRYVPAESLYMAALDILTAEMGPEHPDVRAAHHGLAELYEILGRPDQAGRHRSGATRTSEPGGNL